MEAGSSIPSGRSVNFLFRLSSFLGCNISLLIKSAELITFIFSRPRSIATVDSKCRLGGLRLNCTVGMSESSKRTRTGSLGDFCERTYPLNESNRLLD